MKLPRPVPLGLATVALLVIFAAAFPRAAVQDAVTFQPIEEVTLRRPTSYVLLAPVSNVLDTVTLLGVRQHIALLVTLIVGYLVWWWFYGRKTLSAFPPRRRVWREIARLGVGLVLLLTLYVAVAILPRPMAALETKLDIIVLDFHTHTRYSHDGRPDWAPEDVRAWHRNAGFDAAFVTDHRTFEGARDAWPNNPARAGEGTSMLPAIEAVWRGEHVNVLDADRFYRGLLTESLRDVDDQALALASAIPGNEPVLIETLPGDLSKVVAATGPGTPGVRAIEIIDGAPRGLSQTRRERARIVHLADSLNLTLVAGSDHHGWGHTASGWTLMVLPRWREIAPEQLTAAISKGIRAGGRGVSRVAERYVPDTETGVELPLTVPIVGWGMLRTMTTDERVVWVVWTIALYLLWRLREAWSKSRNPST